MIGTGPVIDDCARQCMQTPTRRFQVALTMRLRSNPKTCTDAAQQGKIAPKRSTLIIVLMNVLTAAYGPVPPSRRTEPATITVSL
jgi:hypothetical protein